MRVAIRRPRERGRLTLNPLPHIDPVGTLLVPGLLLVTSLVLGSRPFVLRLGEAGADRSALVPPAAAATWLLVALAGPGHEPRRWPPLSAVALGWLAAVRSHGAGDAPFLRSAGRPSRW